MRSYSRNVGYCELCRAPITAEVATQASLLARKNRGIAGIINMEDRRTELYTTLTARNQDMIEGRSRLVDELHALAIALRRAWDEHRTEYAWANRDKIAFRSDTF